MADEALDREARDALARLDERQRALDARLTQTVETGSQSLMRLLEEREKRFIERLAAEERNRALDIKALETRLLDAMVATDKAVIKAEQAQREYNARSNEFRGQLDDQQKTLMPRAESQNYFKSVEDRFVALQLSFEEKLNGLQRNTEKVAERNREDIVSLRESRSEVSGRRVGNNELIAVIVGVALVLSTLFIAVVPALIHK